MHIAINIESKKKEWLSSIQSMAQTETTSEMTEYSRVEQSYTQCIYRGLEG